ncbi:MAG TPA: hypothetical protein P5287_05650 [bacterium]|nr:hypothetical protein [bacterium]
MRCIAAVLFAVVVLAANAFAVDEFYGSERTTRTLRTERTDRDRTLRTDRTPRTMRQYEVENVPADDKQLQDLHYRPLPDNTKRE